MKKVLSAIFVFVALCLMVAFWTLRDFDRRIQSEIVTVVSEKTGRALTIDGKVEMNFSLSPSVRISNIKLANAPWSSDPYMIQVGSLEMQIELMPLFRRKTEIKQVLLKSAQAVFEINEDGQKNWLFPKEAETADAQDKAASEKIKKKNFSFPDINKVVAEDISLQFVNQRKGTVSAASINTLTADKKQNGFSLDSQWNVNQNALKATLDAEVRPDSPQYDFQLKVDGQNIQADLQGTIENPLTDIQGRSTLTLRLPQASVLNRMSGYSLPAMETILTADVHIGPDGFSVPTFDLSAGTENTALIQAAGTVDSFSPLSLRFQTRVKAPNMGAVQGLPAWPDTTISAEVQLNAGLLLDNLNMRVGDSDLSGSVLAQTEQAVLIQAKLRSDRFHLTDFLGKGKYPVAFGSFSDSTKKRKSRVFSSELLPFEALRSANIDIDVSADQFGAADGTDLGKVNLTASMHDGVFILPTFKLADYAKVSVKMDASKQPADVAISLKADKLPLPFFFAQNNVERGTVTGSIRFVGRGESEADIASSLTGRMFVNVRDVYISSFQLLTLPETLSFLYPLDPKQPLSVSCAVVNLPVKSGLISSEKGIGMESDLFDAQANGDVNLSDESVKLKVDVSPRSQGVLKSVFNSFSVNGELADPEIRFDSEQAFDKALSIGMAFLSGGKEAAREMMKQQKLQNVCQAAMAVGK